jgi:hypothetical protein
LRLFYSSYLKIVSLNSIKCNSKKDEAAIVPPNSAVKYNAVNSVRGSAILWPVSGLLQQQWWMSKRHKETQQGGVRLHFQLLRKMRQDYCLSPV